MDKWENAVHYQTVQKEKAAKVKAVNTDRIEEVLSGAKEHVEIDYGEEQILSSRFAYRQYRNRNRIRRDI